MPTVAEGLFLISGSVLLVGNSGYGDDDVIFYCFEYLWGFFPPLMISAM